MDRVDPHFLLLCVQEGKDLLLRIANRAHERTSSLPFHFSLISYATSLSKDLVIERDVEEGFLGNRIRLQRRTVVHDFVQQRLR